jgi:hypothetical protein
LVSAPAAGIEKGPRSERSQDTATVNLPANVPVIAKRESTERCDTRINDRHDRIDTSQ